MEVIAKPKLFDNMHVVAETFIGRVMIQIVVVVALIFRT